LDKDYVKGIVKIKIGKLLKNLKKFAIILKSFPIIG
jgi:hypothetical protein